MASLLYIATHGPDDPTKACLPFRLTVNSANTSFTDVAQRCAAAINVLVF